MKLSFLLLLLAAPALVRAAGPDAGPCVPCDLLFASTGGSDGLLFTIDPATGATAPIGPVASYSDIALTPDGRLYGLGSGGRLHALDPCTATATPLDLLTTRPGATGTTAFGELLTSGSFLQLVDLVGETTTDLSSGGWCGFAAGDLALNPCDGTAWQVSRGPACPCPSDDAILERLDPLTGDLIEQITCLPFPALFGLAFDSSCTLWLVDAMSGSLIRFDPLARDWVIVPSEPLGGVLGLASVPCGIEGACQAGGPYLAACGSAPCSAGEARVVLDATASALPSASPLQYDWTITCPGGGVATASGAAPSPCVPAGCGEVCDVDLVVSNIEGRSLGRRTTLTVHDDLAPSLLALPADAVVDCAAVPAPAAVTAIDACDGALGVGFREVRLDGDCPGEHRLLRTWSATDDCGNSATATQVLQVFDETPPLVERREEIVACLWPPNHRFVRLDAELFAPVVSDACSEPVSWRLADCESDEPDDGLGDGRTRDDCRIADDGGSLLVRAERLGNERGRTYSVSVVATDACGNESAPTLGGRIRVPHDSREHADCLSATGSPGRRLR